VVGIAECLHAHGLLGEHATLGVAEFIASASLRLRVSVYLGLDDIELAGDVRCVTVEHGCVSLLDLSGMIQHDDLGAIRN